MHSLLKTWDKIQTHTGWRDRYIPNAPIWSNAILPAEVRSAPPRDWTRSECQTVGDMFAQDGFTSFQQLQTRWGLDGSAFLGYLQIHSTMSHIWPSFPREPVTNEMLQILQGLSHSRNVSRLYSHLILDHYTDHIKVKQKWDRDMGEFISDEDWARACSVTKTVSLYSRHKAIQFRFLHRAYLSPIKLHLMNRDRSPDCPSCPGTTGTFIHMVWECPTVRRVWEEVSAMLSEFAGRLIPCTLGVCLLSILRGTKHQKEENRLIQLLLLLVKRQIALNWLRPDRVTVLRWIHDARLNAYVYQRIPNVNPRMMGIKMVNLWEVFDRFINENDKDPPQSLAAPDGVEGPSS